MMTALYDARQSTWDFKLPWRDRAGNTCVKFGLDSSPPALLFGCGTVQALAAAGSDELTTIEGSEHFHAGSGNAGLAAWSEVPPGLPRTSRIRTWSPETGPHVLVDSMPGVAKGVAVSADRITGLRSGDPNSTNSLLVDAEFWAVSRQGGAVQSWRVPDAAPVGVTYGSTWGDYAAVQALTEGAPGLPQAERSHRWLIRLSDGKMRRFVPSPGRAWRGSLHALDDTHYYSAEDRQGDNATSLDRVYRYRLDRFDAIGMPLE